MAKTCINVNSKKRKTKNKQYEDKLKNNTFGFTFDKGSIDSSYVKELEPQCTTNGLELLLEKGIFDDYNGTSATMRNIIKMLQEQ